MHAIYQWTHIIRRRFFPWFWPLLLAVALIGAGLVITDRQRQVYIREYIGQSQHWATSWQRIADRSEQGPADATTQKIVRVYRGVVSRTKQERELVQGDARQYTAGLLQTYQLGPPGLGLWDNKTGQIKAGYRTPTVLMMGQVDDHHELDLTQRELTSVLAKHLTPMHPARQLTHELSTRGERTQAQYDRITKRFYEYGWYYLQHLVEGNWGLLLVAGLVLLFGLSGTFQRDPQTGKNIFLQLAGVTGQREFFGSYGYALGASAVGLIGVGAGGLLVSLAVNGMGSPAYPLVVWTGMLQWTFMPLWQMLWRELLLLWLLTAFLLSVVYLVRGLTRQPLLAVGIGVATLGLGMLAPVAWWSPMGYLNVHQIVDGFVATTDPLRSFAHGWQILGAWTVVMLAGGALLQWRQSHRAH